DGQLLFTASDSDPRGDSTIRVWRTATGELLRECKGGHHARITALALSPDSTRLAACDSSNVAMIWDVANLPAPKVTPPLIEKEAESLWQELRNRDGEMAYRAIHRLAETGAASVVLLRQKTKELRVPDEKRMAKLLNDMDSDEFDIRETASHELER